MKTIVFDFDGVIAEAGKWEGHEKIGPAREKWLNILKRLSADGYTCHLMTCRLNPNPFGNGVDETVASGSARRILESWLMKQGIRDCFKHLTGKKIYGDVYIDDRSIGFQGLDVLDEDTLYQIITGATIVKFPREVEGIQ